MIRYITLALGLASASAFAASTVGNMSAIPSTKADAKQGFHGQVGLGAASLPEYVGGDDNETVGVPLINVSYNDRFYFKYNKLGGWLFKSDNGFRAGGVITVHRGFDKDDVKVNAPLQDREDSIMAGINMAYSRGMFNAEVGFVNDISDESDGAKLYAQATYTLLANEKYSVSIMGKLESLDEDMAAYYYRNDESTVNATLGLIGTYKLTDRWTLLGAVTGTSLGDEATEGTNTWVTEDSYTQALLGATYSF
ncbi:MipA/OmpV family protein [Thalassotalea euphylliae]|uniref:MipA/OmpV family protein n=1 Tax=Thalassotalea euphylliae TaxID=1655234 RepID=UPI00363AF9B5